MKKITSREEANIYFNKVNVIVDDYINKHRIRPSEIYHYINRNYDSFLEETGLKEIDNIKLIVNNVLEHRLNMQKDQVMKFESFSLVKEDVMSITKPNIEHEKILADYFNTSVGHIECVDESLHMYLVNDLGVKKYAFIFSKEEIDVIKSNLLKELIKETSRKMISINEVNDRELGFSLRFWLSDIIDEDKFRDFCISKIGEDSVLKFITSFILSSSNLLTQVSSERLKFSGEFHNYLIWDLS